VTRVQLAALAGVLAVLAGAGFGIVASHVSPPAAASAELSRMHGQASWAPGQRRAPSLRLHDQDGRPVTLERLRGRPVLMTFLDSQCDQQCPLEGRQLGIMLTRMQAADRPTLVVVSVNPAGDTPASIRHAMAKWNLAGQRRWHWLRGSGAELARVWADYGITVRPTSTDITHGMSLYLIDRRGFERAGYLFPFLPNFVGLDLEELARERL
jgi:protein SCO1/2